MTLGRQPPVLRGDLGDAGNAARECLLQRSNRYNQLGLKSVRFGVSVGVVGSSIRGSQMRRWRRPPFVYINSFVVCFSEVILQFVLLILLILLLSAWPVIFLDV